MLPETAGFDEGQAGAAYAGIGELAPPAVRYREQEQTIQIKVQGGVMPDSPQGAPPDVPHRSPQLQTGEYLPRGCDGQGREAGAAGYRV